MEEEKKEGTKRKDRKNNCFTGSSFECDIFFHKYTLRVTGHFSTPKIRRTYAVCVCVCVCVSRCVCNLIYSNLM
jgi:hypothetical protein